MDRLFIYGTLAPGRPNEHVLADVPGEWESAYVRGRLLQQGWGSSVGYPGIVLDERGEKVPGFIFSSEHLEEHWSRLDEFEGEEYERVLAYAELEDGTNVQVQIYVLSMSAAHSESSGS